MTDDVNVANHNTASDRTAAIPRVLFAWLFGGLVALLALASLRWLSTVDPLSGAGWATALAGGNLGPLLLTGDFWSNLPTMPYSDRVAALTSTDAAVLVGSVAALCCALMRILLRGSWTRVGVATLAIALTPLLMLGALPIEAPAERIAHWLRILICAALYAGLFTVAMGTLDLIRPTPLRAHDDQDALEPSHA